MGDLADEFPALSINENHPPSARANGKAAADSRPSGGGGGGRSNRSGHGKRVQGTGWGNMGSANNRGCVRGRHDNYGFAAAPQFTPSTDPPLQKPAPVTITDPSLPVKNFHAPPVAPVSGKNTETFKPDHTPAELRFVPAPPGLITYDRPHTPRDVVVVQDLFPLNDYNIYETLLEEVESSGIGGVWVSWHGDSHVIADDKVKWKYSCPTFTRVLEKMSEYFKMDIQATRLNWYRDYSEWKPFHHDAAAVKADKAETQNITVATSFGAERSVEFQHAKTRTVVSVPLLNGSVYSFGKDVNIIWRHGIPQLPPNAPPRPASEPKGRISIIAWGWHHLGES